MSFTLEGDFGTLSTYFAEIQSPARTLPMTKSTTIRIPTSIQEIATPERCALVVYDMQAGILSQLPHGPEILTKVLEVLEIARAEDFCIFFMRHMSLPTKLAGVFQLRQAMLWQRVDRLEAVKPRFLRGSAGFDLAPELGVRDDEAIFDKIAMSAFEGTPLAMALRDRGLISFMICGIATEIGIDPTVRHGADLGFIPIVVEDACGHGYAEAANRSIENIRFMGDALITSVRELREMFEPVGGP
jgi:nicotinamidase-related amidase